MKGIASATFAGGALGRQRFVATFGGQLGVLGNSIDDEINM
jgi:hypothetical protein